MSLDTPTGTRGARTPGASSPIAKWVGRVMGRQHRRAGYKFQGMDILFLTTTGRKSGQPHEHPVALVRRRRRRVADRRVGQAARPRTRPGT